MSVLFPNSTQINWCKIRLMKFRVKLLIFNGSCVCYGYSYMLKAYFFKLFVIEFQLYFDLLYGLIAVVFFVRLFFLVGFSIETLICF